MQQLSKDSRERNMQLNIAGICEDHNQEKRGWNQNRYQYQVGCYLSIFLKWGTKVNFKVHQRPIQTPAIFIPQKLTRESHVPCYQSWTSMHLTHSFAHEPRVPPLVTRVGLICARLTCLLTCSLISFMYPRLPELDQYAPNSLTHS